MGYYEEQNKCRQTFESTLKDCRNTKQKAILIKPLVQDLLRKFAVGEKFIDKMILNYSDNQIINYKIKGNFLMFDYKSHEEELRLKALSEVEEYKKDLETDGDD